VIQSRVIIRTASGLRHVGVWIDTDLEELPDRDERTEIATVLMGEYLLGMEIERSRSYLHLVTHHIEHIELQFTDTDGSGPVPAPWSEES